MNKAIEELIKQATSKGDWSSVNNRYMEVFDKEKFARLIISDVLSICEDMGDEGLDGHHCSDAILRKYE
jgi:hypothetical protein